MTHVESDELVIRLRLSAAFADDYEGDDDGREWLRRWQAEVRPAVLAAVVGALRRPGWRVYPTSRGASPDREVEISVERREAEPGGERPPRD